MRRSQKVKSSVIANDYTVYLQESDFDIGIDQDLVSFLETMNCADFKKRKDVIREELTSMEQNNV